MKRIISIFVSLVLLLSGLSVYGQEADGAVASDRTLESLEILQALDFVNKDYNTETTNFGAAVTRADFAAAAGKIFNIYNQKGTELYFYDVSRDHFAYDAVTFLADTGAINGNGAKLFRPDDEITLVDASKIVLHALGYDYMVQVRGGYPGGVNAVASQIGLYDGIGKDGNSLTYGDMFNLLYNAIMTEIPETTGVSSESITYDTMGNTFLNNAYSIYFEKGEFTGYNGVCYGNADCYEKQAVISETVFETDGSNYSEFLGCEVKYLYEYDKKADDYKLIWVKSTGRADVVELDYEVNGTEFDESVYKLNYFDENNKERSITISKGVNVIYNGRVLESGIVEVFKGGFDTIRLVKAYSEKEYTVAVASKYDSFVVGSVDTMQQKIYDLNSKRVVDLKGVEEVYIYNASGLLTTLSAISKNSVVSVFGSMDSEVVKVYVSDKVFEGTIDACRKVNGTDVYTIDGKNHSFDKNFDPSAYSAGDAVKAYVDVKGKIVYMEVLTGSSRFGYLINIAVAKDENNLEDGLYFRLLTDNNEMLSKVKCSKNAKIDGMSVKENYPNRAFNILGGAAYKSEMVVFRLNSKGEVIFLDTLAPNEGSYFRKIRENQYYIRSASELFTNSSNIPLDSNGSVLVAPTAKVFNVTSDKTEEDRKFRVDKYSAYTNNHFESMSAYTASKSDYHAEALLMYDFLDVDVTTGSSTTILVTDIVQALNDDGEVVKYIVGLSYGGEVQMECATEYSPTDLTYGDLVSIGVNRHMEVTGTVKLYDVVNNVVNIPFNYYNVHASSSFQTYGRVYDVVDGKYVYLASESNPERPIDFYRSLGAVYIYDSETKEITEGTINDLKTTKSSGLGDKLFIWYGHSTQVRLVVVWR